MSEGLPAHEEDELLEKTGALSVGNTINQRFSNICVFAISLNIVISWHQVVVETPSLVIGKMQP